ncbi:MAG: DNA-directed RNA polymerase subunit omega [Defluviitaleaceae bacterium]|nr:DNA-directed RNA polymerase subunit omega [Defluviitaleaceae bacterium]
MLQPSYSELMNKLNETNEVDSQITSRYTIVIAAAKRARQLIDGQIPLCYATDKDKPVSIAVNEMYQGKLKVIDKISGDDEYYRAIREQMIKSNAEDGQDTF